MKNLYQNLKDSLNEYGKSSTQIQIILNNDEKNAKLDSGFLIYKELERGENIDNIKNIDNIFANIPKLNKQLIVYTCYEYTRIDINKPIKQFMSTSLSYKNLIDWCITNNNPISPSRKIIKIIIPKNNSIIPYIYLNHSEYEIILDRNFILVPTYNIYTHSSINQFSITEEYIYKKIDDSIGIIPKL